MGLDMEVSPSGRAIHISSNTSMEFCQCWFSANLMSPKEDFPELSQLLPLCLGFFFFPFDTHLTFINGKHSYTLIIGRENMGIGCDLSNLFNKKGPVGSLGFSQYCRAALKLLLARYLLVSSGPCLSRGKGTRWKVCYVFAIQLNCKAGTMDWLSFSLALSQKNQAYCCKCRMVS